MSEPETAEKCISPTSDRGLSYLDFVASHHILAEKHGGFLRSIVSGKRGFESPLEKLNRLVFFTITFGISSLSLFVHYFSIGQSHSVLGNWLLVVPGTIFVSMCYGAIAVMLLSYTLGKVWRGFPTNIRLGEEKFWFAWCGSETSLSQFVPFSAVQKVDIEEAERDRPAELDSADLWKGKRLVIEIDRTYLRQIEGWKFLGQMQSLWRNGKPYALKYGNYDKSIIQLAIPLDAMTLDSDREKLVEALKARVSKDCLTEKFLEVEAMRSAPGITRLWLEEMNSFRRTRDNELEPGTTLASERFSIVSKLATGGQAKIYNAVTKDGEYVALKELILPLHAGSEVRERSIANVKREAKLLASFEHPAIVKIIDSFIEDHRAYLVLEKVEGNTVRKIVKECGAMAPETVLSCTIQIAEILAYLHGFKPPVVHRDLAPDNLMLNGGKIKLIDFNVAQQLESTSTKTVVGKHNYMAPEQFRGQPCEQSDLYSLGATIAFMLTGEDPTPLSQVARDETCPNLVTRGLLDIAHKLTALELAGRYASAGNALEDLAAVRLQLSHIR